MKFSKTLLSILLLSTSISSYSFNIIFNNKSKHNLPNYKLMIAPLGEDSSTTILGESLSSGGTNLHKVDIISNKIYLFGIFTSFEKVTNNGKKKFDKFCIQIKSHDKLKNEYTVMIEISQDDFENGDANLDIFDENNNELTPLPSLMRLTLGSSNSNNSLW